MTAREAGLIEERNAWRDRAHALERELYDAKQTADELAAIAARFAVEQWQWKQTRVQR